MWIANDTIFRTARTILTTRYLVSRKHSSKVGVQQQQQCSYLFSDIICVPYCCAAAVVNSLYALYEQYLVC